MNPYPKMKMNAAKRLLVGVIKQAVEDYRGFEKRGLIVNGQVKKPARTSWPVRRASRVQVTGQVLPSR